MAATATAGHNSASIYDSYSCTLQGQAGITYVVEGSNLAGLRNACLGFKDAL